MRYSLLPLIIIAFLLAFLISGCAKSRYVWDGYDDRLYSYYKTPAESERLLEGIYEVIREGEAENRVPPGIYAEYGYLLYERGKFTDASVWFAKERDKWPESRFFMDRMITLANGKGRQAPAGNRSELPGTKLP